MPRIRIASRGLPRMVCDITQRPAPLNLERPFMTTVDLGQAKT